MMKVMVRSATLGLLLAFLGGCAKEVPPGEQPKTAPTNKAAATKIVDDHSGWWCPEHGIPEEECSMCSSKYAKQCKANGDWCKKHDRALSQCFICDPSLKEKYAAKYRVKYGAEPPPIAEELEE